MFGHIRPVGYLDDRFIKRMHKNPWKSQQMFKHMFEVKKTSSLKLACMPSSQLKMVLESFSQYIKALEIAHCYISPKDLNDTIATLPHLEQLYLTSNVYIGNLDLCSPTVKLVDIFYIAGSEVTSIDCPMLEMCSVKRTVSQDPVIAVCPSEMTALSVKSARLQSLKIAALFVLKSLYVYSDAPFLIVDIGKSCFRSCKPSESKVVVCHKNPVVLRHKTCKVGFTVEKYTSGINA